MLTRSNVHKKNYRSLALNKKLIGNYKSRRGFSYISRNCGTRNARTCKKCSSSRSRGSRSSQLLRNLRAVLIPNQRMLQTVKNSSSSKHNAMNSGDGFNRNKLTNVSMVKQSVV